MQKMRRLNGKSNTTIALCNLPTAWGKALTELSRLLLGRKAECSRAEQRRNEGEKWASVLQVRLPSCGVLIVIIA